MSPDATPAPQPTRTWWHPILAQTLRRRLHDAYEVRDEVPVGELPLRLDLLILRRQRGRVDPAVRASLAGLLEHLGRLTLLEFKGPTETLRAGDAYRLLAQAYLYLAQQTPPLPPRRLKLLVLAPRRTAAFRQEVRYCGGQWAAAGPGAWQIAGWPFPATVVETLALADEHHPLLTLFSPALLANQERVARELATAGFGDLLVEVWQNIKQFDLSRPEVAMRYRRAEEANQALTKAMTEFVASLTPEEMALFFPAERRLESLTAEQRLAGLAPEQRLAGLAPEQRLAGLSPEELARLRQFLESKAQGPK